MSDVYREIMEEGEQKGRREGALQSIAGLLTRRFSARVRDLDALVARCQVDDLEWLVLEVGTTKSFPALKRSLEARLSGR